MGDSGSILIGLLLATATITLTGNVDPSDVGTDIAPACPPLLLPIAVLVVPFLDLLLAVVRRTPAGRSPFAPDKQHLHHRLLEIGRCHAARSSSCTSGPRSCLRRHRRRLPRHPHPGPEPRRVVSWRCSGTANIPAARSGCSPACAGDREARSRPTPGTRPRAARPGHAGRGCRRGLPSSSPPRRGRPRRGLRACRDWPGRAASCCSGRCRSPGPRAARARGRAAARWSTPAGWCCCSSPCGSSPTPTRCTGGRSASPSSLTALAWTAGAVWSSLRWRPLYVEPEPDEVPETAERGRPAMSGASTRTQPEDRPVGEPRRRLGGHQLPAHRVSSTGGVGWLVDWWLGTRGFVAAGIVLGAALRIALITLRYSKP